MLYPFAVSAQEAEIGLYHQTLVEENETTPRFFLDGYSYLGERWGVWGVGYAERGYASAAIGPYLDLAVFDNDAVIEAGVAAGAEAIEDEELCSCEPQYFRRFAGFLYAGNERINLDAYYENGQSEEAWTRVVLHWQATNRLAFGAIHQTGDGTGPRVLLSIFRPMRVWVAPMFGEKRKLLFGIDLIFKKERK
jgi:hypothetical protein